MMNAPRYVLPEHYGPEHFARIGRIINHEPPETLEGLSWFVVVCNPKGERRAQLGLRRAGYQTYLPQTKRWVAHARKKEARENPLFPRYLFLGLAEGQDFYRMRGVDGVESLVRNDSIPIRIPAGSLAQLLDREQAGEFDFTRMPEQGPQYAPGEIVRLSTGALTDMTGHVLGMLSKGRVEVLIDFMGRGAKVQIKAAELQRLEAAE